MVESSFDVQPTAIATSTTNLININISNSGNITAVATGENHQINKCYSTITPNAQLRLAQPNTQPRTAQYASLPLASNQTTEPQQRSPLTANVNQIEVFGSDLNAISTIATTSAETSTDALSCNYKNCSISNSLTKPKNRNEVVFQTPQHNRVKKNGDANLPLMRNQPNNNTILPPPLFDESTTMSTATLPLLPNDSIRQLKSRRHHRTIPRHFTLNDATNHPNGTNSKPKANDEPNKASQNCSGTATLNKKSICQCPVQHVPMFSNMGSAYLNLTRNQQTNEMLLSTLTKKWPSQKAHVAKSASFTSTPSMASTTTSTTVIGYNRNSASGLLSAINPPKSNSNTGSTVAETQTNAVHQPKTSKISTISKQIGHNELNSIAHAQVQQHSNDASNDAKSMQELLPININNSGTANNSNPLSGSKNVGFNSESDGMILVSNTTNPVLPPKLSKAQVFSRQTECMPSISKLTSSTNCASGSNGSTMTSSITNHHRLSGRDRSKSPAADKTYSMVTPLNLGADQKINHIKTTYPTTANLTIASNHFTLPKPTSSAAKPLLSVKNQNNPQNVASNSQSKLLNSKVHSSSSKAKKMMTSPLQNDLGLRQELQSNEMLSQMTNHIDAHRMRKTDNDKPLPVCTTFTNCSNPKEHFLPNDTSCDDDYLSECENCKSAHGSRYYLDEEHLDQPQETMTLQRKMDEKECDEQPYYRTSSTLPTNTKQKTT